MFIEDVLSEINILIMSYPQEDRRQIHDIAKLPDAERELLRLLGAQDCKCSLLVLLQRLMCFSRRQAHISSNRNPGPCNKKHVNTVASLGK